MTNWKPGMKAVCVDDRGVRPPYSLKAGNTYTIDRVDVCCKTTLIIKGAGWSGKHTQCQCGHFDTFEWMRWNPSRFRPLLGDEQSELDAIEEDVKEAELILA